MAARATMKGLPRCFIPECILTDHGLVRMVQRSLDQSDIFECELWGRHARYQHGGVDLWRIDCGIIRRLSRLVPGLGRLEGVTVIESPEGVVITAYRNRVGRRLLRKRNRPGRGTGAQS